MDGTRTQKDIVDATSIHKGLLSTMVGELRVADLLSEDKKHPKLSISIPTDFFEADAERN